MLALKTERFEARELLQMMLANNWDVSEHEKVQIQALAYPWQTSEGPAFVQSPGGIWRPSEQ